MNPDVPAQAPLADLRRAAERSNAASFALWPALAEANNAVASAHSIREALALLYMASSSGEGRSQIGRLMHFPDDARHMDVGLLRQALNASQSDHYSSAGALWIAEQVSLQRPFLDAVSNRLPTEVRAVNFLADPERARQQINAWVSEKTSTRIPEILRGGEVTPQTRVALVNTARFKGEWVRPFDPEQTTSKPFRRPGKRPTYVPTMVGGRGAAIFDKDFAAGYLGYAGTSLSFVVVVPKRWGAFAWDLAAFRRVLDALDDARQAQLELPKLRLRSRIDLREALAKVGVALSAPGLLSELLEGDEPITLDCATHEVFLQVDEQLTEAYSATAITATVPISAKEPPPVLRVDRPFYFLLVDRETDLIAFMGKVSDPSTISE